MGYLLHLRHCDAVLNIATGGAGKFLAGSFLFSVKGK
jgi:hypothetical protein